MKGVDCSVFLAVIRSFSWIVQFLATSQPYCFLFTNIHKKPTVYSETNFITPKIIVANRFAELWVRIKIICFT